MNEGRTRISVLLVDDHAVVREGYRRLLERQGQIDVIGDAADAQTALDLFLQLAPQVVVMDITLPGVSGIEVMRRMLARVPDGRILIFSMHDDVIFARRAMQSGAFGYVTKASAPEVLVEAVRAVAVGTRFLSPAIAHELALQTINPHAAGGESLSAREVEVLRLLVQGQSPRDIAASIGLTHKTVANLQSSIKQKLGVETPIQLLQAAGRLGISPAS